MGPGSMGNPPRVVRTEGGGRALPRGQGEGGREGGLAGSRCTVKALGICPSATLRLRARPIRRHAEPTRDVSCSR